MNNVNACIQVMHLSCEHGADLMLNKEARTWSAKVTHDIKTIHRTTKEMNKLMDQIKIVKVLPNSMSVNFLYADGD